MVIEAKQILTMIIIIIVFFLISILSVVGLYFYKPSLLGFPEPQKTIEEKKEQFKIDDIPLTTTINISEKKLQYFEKILKQKKNLLKTKDSLIKNNDNLSDSIKKLFDLRKTAVNEKMYADSLLNDTLKIIRKLYDSIFALNIDLKKSKNKLENLNQTVKDQENYILQESDSLDKVNFQDFAKIYNNTNPDEVAKILEQIDERDAAKILKQMSVKKAGKVLEAMTPENAAAILLLGGGK